MLFLSCYVRTLFWFVIRIRRFSPLPREGNFPVSVLLFKDVRLSMPITKMTYYSEQTNSVPFYTTAVILIQPLKKETILNREHHTQMSRQKLITYYFQLTPNNLIHRLTLWVNYMMHVSLPKLLNNSISTSAL